MSMTKAHPMKPASKSLAPSPGRKSKARQGATAAAPAAAKTATDLWNAVVARDRAFDGTFYYAVATTGVYCRPSCPARLAKRGNVTFYASCAEAEHAGFRPCKRCKPREPSQHTRDVQKIAEACRWIDEADEPPKLDALARLVGLSPFHFHRLFKAVTGITPKAYAAARRQHRVRESLIQSPSVTTAIHDAGFNSAGRFYAKSSDILGMTPTDFRAGAPGTAMRFAISQCSLGAILVAASEKGITAIFFGSDPDALVQDLENRFPNAELIGGDAGFERTVAQVVAHVDAPEQAFDLPLDVRGTAFQHRVWQALREIPPGTTVTYTDIANRIGQPKAVRAVASACAANKIAVAIPCHRVVRNDGSLSGYRWGVERKRELLSREARPGRKRS